MIRNLSMALAVLVFCIPPALAQQDTGDAMVLPDASQISQNWLGRTIVHLELTQGVPFRVFTLDDPARLVMDFRDLGWSGVRADDLLAPGAGLSDVRFGIFRPGWSRLVADLTRPMLPESVDMAIDRDTGHAILSVALASADAQAFAAQSAVPNDALWPETALGADVPKVAEDRFTVVIDPGHGGVDPGAERAGLVEKDLMLHLANDLRTALAEAQDVHVVLTRETDGFVSLEARVALAHRVGADAFLSLHADALSEGGAQGATIYTLSDKASDAATAQLAARHNRADLIAGLNLTGADDAVTGVLLDLARQETAPRTMALANALVTRMQAEGGPMNRKPLRRAGFSVLKSAHIPSVLVEVGFLSNGRDRDNIADPEWRQRMARALADAVLNWRETDAAQRSLLRQ